MSDAVPLYWHVCDNFGDAMAPWLVEKITGREARYVEPSAGEDVPFLVTGSILDDSIERGIVWGAGSAYESNLQNLKGPSPSFSIVATRGPASSDLARRAGHHPLAYGDPGLLLPRYFRPSVTIAEEHAVFCSWINEHEVPAGVIRHGSMTVSTEDYVERLLGYETVLAGCLHALIAAIAYGRRVCWVRFPTPLLGDGFKFRDFFASMGIECPTPILIEGRDDVEKALRQATVYDPPNTDDLLACCPFA